MALKSQTRFFISARYGLRFLTAFVQLLQFLHILLVIVKLIFIHWKPWESRHSFGCSCHHRQSAGDESICTVCHSLFKNFLTYCTQCTVHAMFRIRTVPTVLLCGSKFLLFSMWIRGGGGGKNNL